MGMTWLDSDTWLKPRSRASAPTAFSWSDHLRTGREGGGQRGGVSGRDGMFLCNLTAAATERASYQTSAPSMVCAGGHLHNLRERELQWERQCRWAKMNDSRVSRAQKELTAALQRFTSSQQHVNVDQKTFKDILHTYYILLQSQGLKPM